MVLKHFYLFYGKVCLAVNTNFGPFGATNKAPQDGEIADRNSLKI
jgi:hypothetical protein